jgi:hypothetical protein
LNIPHRNKDVATDTVFSDIAAVGFGVTIAQLFNVTITEVSDVFSIKNEREFTQTLQDNIWKRGVMQYLLSDKAHAKISNNNKDPLQTLIISDRRTTARKQWQNPAELRIQTVKRLTNLKLDRTRTDANMCLLSLDYARFVLNHTASDKQDGQILYRTCGRCRRG